MPLLTVTVATLSLSLSRSLSLSLFPVLCVGSCILRYGMPQRSTVRNKPSLTPDTGVGGGAVATTSSSSASSVQPAKKAGQAGASQGGEVDGSKRRCMDAGGADSTASGTRQRIDASMDADDDVNTDGTDEKGAISNPSVRVERPSTKSAAPATHVPSAAAVTSTSPAPSQQSTVLANRYVPCFAGHDTLLNRAQIDNHRDDAIQLQFRVDSRYPACPAVDSLQYKYNAQARQHL